MTAIKLASRTIVACLMLNVALATATHAQEDDYVDCSLRLREAAQKAITAKGVNRWREDFTKSTGISLYDERRVSQNSLKGSLAIAGCADSLRSVLLWISVDDSHSKVQIVLDGVADFLHVKHIGDFNNAGSLKALVIGTSGAGMYYHSPMILQLKAGMWLLIAEPEKPFFYGSTQILPAGPDGNIRLAVIYVDEDAPWAFTQCSLCSHPYRRDVYAVKDGVFLLMQKKSVSYPLSVISDLILDGQEQRIHTAYQLFKTDAVIQGKTVRSREALTAALADIKLNAIGDCHLESGQGILATETIQGKKVVGIGSRSKPSNVRFECLSATNTKMGLEYEATITESGGEYLISDLTLEEILTDETR